MERIYDNCCGIDVHKKLMVACFIHGREQEIQEYGATTRELLEMADWLQQGNCEMIAMESTGSYWKPLYNILESVGLNAMVVNARHMKAVPGRKTDQKDAEWIADLLQHGLLKASYIPDKAQRELRELVSYRKSLVADKARELNRLQKMLEGANIKISGTISQINGKSARNLLELLVKGQRIDYLSIITMLIVIILSIFIVPEVIIIIIIKVFGIVIILCFVGIALPAGCFFELLRLYAPVLREEYELPDEEYERDE